MPRRNGKVTTYRKTSRKNNGGYWTVRYVNDNGMFYNVGNAGSKKEMLFKIITQTEQFPPGEGKVIFVN